jgi:hypothetical protein
VLSNSAASSMNRDRDLLQTTDQMPRPVVDVLSSPVTCVRTSTAVRRSTTHGGPKIGHGFVAYCHFISVRTNIP